MSTSDDAILHVKQHKKEIVETFANLVKYPSVVKPFTIFMAGSPGAGKTEFSNKFDPTLYDYDNSVPIVRIDADAIRKLIPQFKGSNSDEVQQATTIGMDRLFDHIQDHDQNAIVDTTFSDFRKAHENVRRSLLHKRRVGIFYIHLNPKTAWDYTKIREKIEGRVVSDEFFVESYLKAIENVNRIKEEFPEIELNLIDKRLTGNEEDPINPITKFNIPRVDYYLEKVYNRSELLSVISS